MIRLPKDQCLGRSFFMDKIEQHVVPFALCPSSEELDIFLFDPHLLLVNQKGKSKNTLQNVPSAMKRPGFVKQ